MKLLKYAWFSKIVITIKSLLQSWTLFKNHYDIQKCQNIQDLARFRLNGEIVEGQMSY